MPYTTLVQVGDGVVHYLNVLIEEADSSIAILAKKPSNAFATRPHGWAA